MRDRTSVTSLRIPAIVLSVLAGAILAPDAATAQPPPPIQEQSAQKEQKEGTPVDYRIGPGDLLSIGVSGVKQMQETTRVSNSGKIHVPYLGIMKISELTTGELEAEIARQLQEKGLVSDPWVTVRIEQYRAQPVYVLGEVMTPGQFVIKDEMYLVDLITLAAGFNELASPIGYLYRRKPNALELPEGEAPTDDALEIDFQALNEGRNPELNVRLRGGDVLYVPQRRRDFYYVVGDVLRPGVFEMRAEEAKNVLLTRAIAQAGGPTRTAKLSKGMLVRFDKEGKRQELAVDFAAILRGQRPDLRVQPNDIIFIPGSAAKTLAYGLLGIIPGLAGQRTASAIAR